MTTVCMNRRTVLALLLAWLTVPVTQAQLIDDLIAADTDSISDITDAIVPGVSNVRLGFGPVISPDYEGADGYNINPRPMISLQYRDLIQIENNNIRINIFGDDGLFDSKRFRAGPLLKLDSGRNENDSTDLAGLGEVDTTIELGAFASYTRNNIRTRIRLQHDMTSGYSGTKLIADLRIIFIEARHLVVTSSLNAIFANDDYMDAYFSITPLQSQRSGLPPFEAGPGLKNISLSFGANYTISRHWAMVANLGYSRLFGDAKRSPIVSARGSANQFSTGLYAVYVF